MELVVVSPAPPVERNQERPCCHTAGAPLSRREAPEVTDAFLNWQSYDMSALGVQSDTRHGDGGSSGAGKQAKKGAKKRDAGFGTGRGALKANARVSAEYLEKDEFLDENWGLALPGDSVDDGDSQSEDGVGGRPGSQAIAGRKRPLRTLRTLESADDLGDRDEALDAEEDDKALAYAPGLA